MMREYMYLYSKPFSNASAKSSKSRKRIGVIAISRKTLSAGVKVVGSVCGKRDMFCAKKGVKIALHRLFRDSDCLGSRVTFLDEAVLLTVIRDNAAYSLIGEVLRDLNLLSPAKAQNIDFDLMEERFRKMISRVTGIELLTEAGAE